MELKETINYFDEIVKEYNRLKEVESKYTELIYQVETVFPMETRHETALRYIKNAEKSSNIPECSSSSHFL
jgi:predicted S18 family serine protease